MTTKDAAETKPRAPKSEVPTDLSFEDAPEPITSATGVAKPNPFLPKLTELVEAMTTGEDGKRQPTKAAAVTVPEKSEGAVRSRLDAAGDALGVTVRKRVEKVASGNVRIVFNPIEKITRTRKAE